MVLGDGRMLSSRISFQMGDRGVMLTSDRYGGLSEPWPDRIINYDGEFVRFRSIIPGSKVYMGKKERKRIAARANRAFVVVA